MTIKYLDSKRLEGVAGDLTTKSLASGTGGWVEVGRTTLGSAGDTITVSGLADKRYYMFLINGKPSATNLESQIRLNGDTGSNYAIRTSFEGGSDGTVVSTDKIAIHGEGSPTYPFFCVNYLSNLSAKEKLLISHAVGQKSAGAGNAPSRRETVGKHAQTSNPVTSISSYGGSSGWNYSVGDEIVVLGWDPADSHTTNFWEELASVTTTSAGTSVSSDTFTAKKYLWVQVYAPSGASQVVDNFWWRFNGDSGSNYARRYSSQGGADGTATSDSRIQVSRSGVQGDFTNAFIVNNSANEKLMMYNTVPITALGAGTAPNRQEGVGKWTNTASQITSIVVSANADSFPAGWIMKVWGSN